jgi:hypothetical protein
MDFHLLDDLIPSLHRLTESRVQMALASNPSQMLGPVVEYFLARTSYCSSLPCLSDLPTSYVIAAFEEFEKCRSFFDLEIDTTPFARTAEFYRVPPTKAETLDPRWLAFLNRFRSGAAKARFSSNVANGFTGAVEELASNIIEHSGNVATGIIGYRWEDGVFEYVVADAGIGVLATLHDNPQYSQITDHGEAMRFALTDGVSRYATNPDRGRGYRNLFSSLISHGAALRFRTGDRRLVIDGESPSLNLGRISTSGRIPGFLISANCRLGNKR